MGDVYYLGKVTVRKFDWITVPIVTTNDHGFEIWVHTNFAADKKSMLKVSKLVGDYIKEHGDGKTRQPNRVQFWDHKKWFEPY